MTVDFLIGAIRASQDLHPLVKTELEEILHKAEPLKPKEMKIAKFHYQCAKCGSYVGIMEKGIAERFNKKFCGECGQAVNWS